jgi:predicted DNA-binding protein
MASLKCAGGRPRKMVSSRLVTFLCDSEDYQVLKGYAERAGKTMGDVLREAVKLYIREVVQVEEGWARECAAR